MHENYNQTGIKSSPIWRLQWLPSWTSECTHFVYWNVQLRSFVSQWNNSAEQTFQTHHFPVIKKKLMNVTVQCWRCPAGRGRSWWESLCSRSRRILRALYVSTACSFLLLLDSLVDPWGKKKRYIFANVEAPQVWRSCVFSWAFTPDVNTHLFLYKDKNWDSPQSSWICVAPDCWRQNGPSCATSDAADVCDFPADGWGALHWRTVHQSAVRSLTTCLLSQQNASAQNSGKC